MKRERRLSDRTMSCIDPMKKLMKNQYLVSPLSPFM